MRVARQEWKLGQADKDNGVLLLISIKDCQIRIEVGHGLEGVLTDALSSRINPKSKSHLYFRTGDYDNGVKAGARARSSKRRKANTSMKKPTKRRKICN